jgi:hypothetical protein
VWATSMMLAHRFSEPGVMARDTVKVGGVCRREVRGRCSHNRCWTTSIQLCFAPSRLVLNFQTHAHAHVVSCHSTHVFCLHAGIVGLPAHQRTHLPACLPALPMHAWLLHSQARRTSTGVCPPPLEYEASAELQQQLDAAAPDAFICPLGR